MDSPLAVHRAPWVLPISRPPIQDGGVALRAGKICAVSRFSEVLRRHPDAAVLDHPDAVLLPGLINAHTHLELSHLAYLSRQPAPPTFTGWIAQMLAERAKVADDTETIAAAAARTALTEQQRQGVVAIADISNSGLTRNFSSAFTGRLLCFKEYLGLRADEVTMALKGLAKEGVQPCTGHAPYSTHPDLLRALKSRAGRLGHIFPIHVAEPAAENTLINQGTGEIRDFLEQRGFWNDSFQPLGRGSEGSVTYLHRHSLLDRRTLCVHCIQVTEQEIDLLAENGARVCLCPSSNRYLGVGKAPAEKYLRNGILPALGTDSLTSNPELSLWREMRLLAEDHPGIAPADILRMATLGGAQALGLDRVLGSLEAGKEAAIIAAELPEAIRNLSAVQEYLVHSVQQGGGDVHLL
ncbi:MAG: amidohydrolase family protein [Candidatus Electrothrix sp. YB6]